MDDIGFKLAKKYGLEYMHVNSGGREMIKVVWLTHFKSQNSLTLQESKDLIHKLLEEILIATYNDKDFIYWLKKS